jgi:hypothetical protein
VPLHVTGIAKSDLALFGESIQGRGAGGMRVDLLPQAIYRPPNGGGNEGVANEGKRGGERATLAQEPIPLGYPFLGHHHRMTCSCLGGGW